MVQPINESLKALRDRAGYSVRSMADALGMPLSTYSSYERPTYKKPYLPGTLVKALRPHLVGRGDPPISIDEVLALAGVSGGEVADQDEPQRVVRLKPSGNGIQVPEYDVRPQAGGGSPDLPELDGNGYHPVVATWTIPGDYLRAHASDPTAIRIVRVAGDSMEPEYPAGERVAVDTSHTVPSPPGVYVLWDGFGLVLKRVEIIMGASPIRVRLSSINPAYQAYEVDLDEVRINGRVIGKWMWR